jgi:hypothetical protein
VLTAPAVRNNMARVMDVVWFAKRNQRNAMSSSGSAMTDNIMRRAVELLLQISNSKRDAEKVERVASPSQPSATVIQLLWERSPTTQLTQR